MAKKKPVRLQDLSFDELVRHNFHIAMDAHLQGQLSKEDPQFMIAHELLRRINPPGNYQQEGA